MSEISAQKRPSKGVFWRNFTAGDRVGRPLAEWAYRIPSIPLGITTTDLREAEREVQRETALFWFLLNLKPFDLRGGRWFMFDAPGRGFGQAPFAPSPLKAIDVLSGQFGDLLSMDLLQEVSEELAGEWMWEETVRALVPRDAALDQAEARREILAHLDMLTAAIEKLAPDYGGTGHNQPPADEPLTADERRLTLEMVDRAKAGVAAGDRAGLNMAQSAWSSLTPVAEKLGNWLLQRVNDFGTEFAKGAGKSLGEKLPIYALRIIAAAAVWHEVKIVAEQLLHLAL